MVQIGFRCEECHTWHSCNDVAIDCEMNCKHAAEAYKRCENKLIQIAMELKGAGMSDYFVVELLSKLNTEEIVEKVFGELEEYRKDRNY